MDDDGWMESEKSSAVISLGCVRAHSVIKARKKYTFFSSHLTHTQCFYFFYNSCVIIQCGICYRPHNRNGQARKESNSFWLSLFSWDKKEKKNFRPFWSVGVILVSSHVTCSHIGNIYILHGKRIIVYQLKENQILWTKKLFFFGQRKRIVYS